MFAYAKKKENNRWQVQILESIRENGKLRQKTVRNIGVAYTETERDDFVKIAEAAIVSIKNAKRPVLPIFDPFDFHRPKKKRKEVDADARVRDLKHVKTFNDGFSDIFGNVYDGLGLEDSIESSKKEEQWNKILKANVLARIASPQSKRATQRLLDRDFAVDIPLEKTYRMMDHLTKCEDRVKQKIKQTTLSIFEEKVDVLFFDCTTLYFESFSPDELRANGFSKDCKFKETQVLLALVTTKEGLPITYKLFPGNTYEGHTLSQMVDSLKEEFLIDNVVIVADRAMFTKDNLDLLDAKKVKYIVAAKLRSLPKVNQAEILENKDFRLSVVGKELHWLNEFKYKGRRIIVSYSSKRAKKDRNDRQRLIDRLLKKVKDKTVKISELIPNQGTKKFLKIIGGEATVDHNKINRDKQWDGLHGICTNSEDPNISKILERYRDLWTVEEAFRVCKHSLKMRPIYHWTPDRIKAHILLCFVCYAVVKQTKFKLKQKKISISLEQMREELHEVESMLYHDERLKKHYVLPSSTSIIQKTIYKAFGFKREERPYSV